MCPRISPDLLTVTANRPWALQLPVWYHSCHLGQSSASNAPTMGERVHFPSTPSEQGEGKAHVESQLRQVLQVIPTALLLTGHQCCPEGGCQGWVPRPGTNFTTNPHTFSSLLCWDRLQRMRVTPLPRLPPPWAPIVESM